MSLRDVHPCDPAPTALARRGLLGRTAGAAVGAALLGAAETAPASAASEARSEAGRPVRTESGLVTGNPNAPVRHALPPWPALRTTKPLTMELGDTSAPVPAADTEAEYTFLRNYLRSRTTVY